MPAFLHLIILASILSLPEEKMTTNFLGETISLQTNLDAEQIDHLTIIEQVPKWMELSYKIICRGHVQGPHIRVTSLYLGEGL